MKNLVIALLIVAAIALIVGLASYSTRLDVDYVIGVWHDASLFALAAIVAVLVVLVGVVSAVVVGLRTSDTRRTLEAELQRTYVRLREVEAATGAAERPIAAATAVAPSAAAAEQAAGGDDEPAPGP